MSRIPVQVLLALTAAAGLLAGTADAAEYTWDTYSGTGGDSYTTTNSGDTTQFNFTSNAPNPSPAQILRARAFYMDPISATATAGMAGAAANTADPLKRATITIFSSGLGVTSPDAAGQSSPAHASNEPPCGTSSCSPEHALDNNGKKELIAFLLPDTLIDPISIYATPYSYSDTTLDTDVTFLVGGTLSQMCGADAACNETNVLDKFYGKSIDLLTKSVAMGGYGFTMQNNDTDSTAARTIEVLPSAAQGRFVLVAASLTDKDPEDFFKVGVVTTKTGSIMPPPGTASEPGTLMLLASGLGGLAYWRRRRGRPA